MCGAAENMITIAAAGAVEPLVALLVSPAVRVQGAASGALQQLGLNGARARVRCRDVESRLPRHDARSRE